MDTSDEFRPLRDARIWALRGAGFVVFFVLGAAVLGGALSGAAYGAVGRPLRARGRSGDYAAGAVIATPYFFIMIRAVGSLRGDLALLRPLDRVDAIVLVFAAVYIGPLIGHFNLPRLESERFPRTPK